MSDERSPEVQTILAEDRGASEAVQLTPKRENPYVGPQPFTLADSDYFFGREREARDLLLRVIPQRLVLFYAQSGAGKSSLINTRLVPNLKEKGFEVLPVGRVSGEVQIQREVKNVFAYNLMLSLDQSEAETELFADLRLPDFLAQLTTPNGEYFYYDSRPPAEVEPGSYSQYEIWPRALIIDQFEEILTTHLEAWDKREDFFNQLAEALEQDSQLWVVLAMREDYVAGLDPYAHLLPDKLRARFHMQRMKREEALKAIKMPAAKENRPFAGGVAEKLVDNLRQILIQKADGKETRAPGEFVEPVQLQVVCYQLWENLKREAKAEITAEDLLLLIKQISEAKSRHKVETELASESGQAAEGEGMADFVNNALAQFYEEAVAKVVKKTGCSEIKLRNWFDHELITPAGTRGTVYQGKHETAGLPNNIVELLDKRFHLLRAERRAGGTWYELVHDRFVEPLLEANREWWQHQNPIYRVAQDWDQSGRQEYHLYVGPQLKNALKVVNLETTEPVVKVFLRESQKADRARQEQLETTKNLTRAVGCSAMALGAMVVYSCPLLSVTLLVGWLYLTQTSFEEMTFSKEMGYWGYVLNGLIYLVIIGGVILGPGVVGAALGKALLDLYRHFIQSKRTVDHQLQIFREKLELEQA